ncbi:MAG: DUF4340 domain-containing protein, partial [Planctomycetia bacterium]|nr:DUF4340 domain-containing protein [Planctomycetia bacterium]
DAESQLKAVAETFADLKILGVAAKDNKEHELYGVNDPDKAEVGTKGVGTLIAMQDEKGNDLLRMIVGKEVAGATNQRFVRKPSEDWVYVTTIDMAKLPTEFEKWIEKDLLKLSTFDVNRVVLKDYLLLPTQRGSLALQHRMDATLSYDSTRSPDQWKLEDMQIYGKGSQPVVSTLGPLEELNKQKLDDLRNALGDLKIVDVARKPAGLGNSLRVNADKLPSDDAMQLAQYGFYPNPRSDGAIDIYGANGELIVDTKDGVEYVLRFGNIKAQVSSPSTPKKSDKDKAKSSADDEVKVQRYLFVVAQLAPSILTPPTPEPEPAGPEPAKEDKKEGEAAKAGDQKTDEQKAPVIDPQQAERERIRKENERKRNAYNDQRKKAETRVRELNDRFADWYYVVSEDVYKKLRLTRSDIVKESDAGVDRLLQYGGVNPSNVRDLVHGAIFTRGPQELMNTAIFIGGSSVKAGEELLKQVKAAFFGPMRVSVLLDSNGANTTAAAAVLAAAKHLDLKGGTATVLGGTGPVGERAARLLARQGATVRLGSRSLDRAQEVARRISAQVATAKLQAVQCSSATDAAAAIDGAPIVIAAGAAGIELLSAEARCSTKSLRVALQ